MGKKHDRGGGVVVVGGGEIPFLGVRIGAVSQSQK